MGIVPIFHSTDKETCKIILTTCYNAGMRVFEFVDRSVFFFEIFGELAKFVRAEMPRMMLGIGSVMDATSAEKYIQLGADFIVSPVTSKVMATTCNRHKVLWIPGCSTLNEIVKAEEYGADIVKLFPASLLGGPSYIKAIRAVRPFSNFMPTGGIPYDKNAIQEWMKSGALCVGIGSDLFTQKDGTYDKEIIAHQCAQLIKWVHEAQQKTS